MYAIVKIFLISSPLLAYLFTYKRSKRVFLSINYINIKYLYKSKNNALRGIFWLINELFLMFFNQKSA